MERLVIIGGGAAGLMAAVTGARLGKQTVLIEEQERVGKKLLSTGNGKCNYTNTRLSPSCYHADKDGFEMKALGLFGPEDTIAFFRSIGIVPAVRFGSYIYPESMQASAVLDALRMECDRTGVNILTACTVKDIVPQKQGGLRIFTDRAAFQADRLVLACGSAAGIRGKNALFTGGYGYAEKLGHHVVRPLPALCALHAKETDFFVAASGVRVQARVSILAGGKEADSDTGELQITQNGLSGIPVFQVSRTAARALRARQDVRAVVDFLPVTGGNADAAATETRQDELTGADREKRTKAFFRERIEAYPYPSVEMIGNGLLNRRLWNALLKRAGVRPAAKPETLSDSDVTSIAKEISAAEFRILRTVGLDQAQTVTGGIPKEEIDPLTMESRIVPGLYFAGEMIDADGICGGYNLQWAWTSGFLAAGGR